MFLITFLLKTFFTQYIDVALDANIIFEEQNLFTL